MVYDFLFDRCQNTLVYFFIVKKQPIYEKNKKKYHMKLTSGTCFLSNCFRMVGDILEKQRFESSSFTTSSSSSSRSKCLSSFVIDECRLLFRSLVSSNSITRSRSIDCSSSVQLIKSFKLNNWFVHESMSKVNDDGDDDDGIKSSMDSSSSNSDSLIRLPKSLSRLAI